MNQIDLDGLNEQNQDAPNDARVRHLNQLEYLLSVNQEMPNVAHVRHLIQLEKSKTAMKFADALTRVRVSLRARRFGRYKSYKVKGLKASHPQADCRGWEGKE